MTEKALCRFDPSLEEKIRKFRFRKATNIGAISMKVIKEDLMVVLDEEYEDTTIEELADELPTAEPRYLLISYKLQHGDGRVSYPLCFVYYTPPGAKPDLKMLYSGSKLDAVSKAGITKVFEIRDNDELTVDWLEEQLAFFR